MNETKIANNTFPKGVFIRNRVQGCSEPLLVSGRRLDFRASEGPKYGYLVALSDDVRSKSYIIKFSLSVCLCVSMLVRNRLPNHAYYGDEAFTGDSVGLG